MEIEQKERERIEAKYPFDLPPQVKHSPPIWDWKAIQLSRQGSAMEEHIYLQKEVIQPLRDEIANWKSLSELNYQESISKGKTIYKPEAENKALREMLTQISAWLSFNTNPNAEEISEMKKSIDQLLKNEG